MKSPWWGDLLQVGIVAYTSQRLYGPDDKGGTKLLAPPQEPITVLGEAFGAIRFAGETVTAYRQLINRPFINPQDNRMVPNTFEAYTLTGAAGPVTYIGGYITKEKTRDTESFRWMSDVAGGGDARGLRAAYGVYLIGERRIWAPRANSADCAGLAYPPLDAGDFVAFADAVIQSERIAALLERGAD